MRLRITNFWVFHIDLNLFIKGKNEPKIYKYNFIGYMIFGNIFFIGYRQEREMSYTVFNDSGNKEILSD